MQLPGIGEHVPGLPPYSLSVNHNTASILPANQHSDISGSQTIAHSSPCPISDSVSAPANQCSSYSIASVNQEQSNNQNTRELNTSPQYNLNTDFQRSGPEHTDLSYDAH